MRGSGKIFAVSCRPTAVASSAVSGSAIVGARLAAAAGTLLIALQIDFVLGCCDAQVVAAEGHRLPCDCFGITSATPQLADDLLRRLSRQPRANSCRTPPFRVDASPYKIAG